VRHAVRTAAGLRYALHFAAEPPALASGARVLVRGVKLRRAMAVGGTGTSVRALATPLPGSFGVRRTAVILVNFQDHQIEPYTRDHARKVFFETTSNFFREASYGQTSVSGDVFGWYTIPLSRNGCDGSRIATLARTAATDAGANLSGYNNFVFAFPQIGCPWWGAGTVGGNPAGVWINGTLELMVAAHEMGHNFGLGHSHALECGRVTLDGSCNSIEYGDTVDAMGGSAPSHFNAFQKERIGWLDYGASPPILHVTDDGTYAVDAYETAASGVKALAIPRGTTPPSFYYVEYRRPLGFDAFLGGNANLMGGVVVHLGSDGGGSQLLDMTPTTDSWYDPALLAGSFFSDEETGISIAPVSTGATGATVRVSFSPQTCVPAAPRVTLAPVSGSAARAGTTLAYEARVTSQDGPGCTTSNFALDATAPSGWTTALGLPRLSLAPGATGTLVLQVTSPESATDGTYPVDLTAASQGGPEGAASTSYTVASSSTLAVVLVTDRPAYARNGLVAMTAGLRLGATPVAGGTVRFRVETPRERIREREVTTDASGFAVWKHRFRPAGTYRLSVETSANGTVAPTATTTFVVR
jgi:hypothetical protein